MSLREAVESGSVAAFDDAIARLSSLHGADVIHNAVDDTGAAPLHLAVRRNDDAMVAAVLRPGARPDAEDEADGCTPLLSCLKRHGANATAVVRRLLAAGASVSARDAATGATAFHFACASAAKVRPPPPTGGYAAPD